MKWEFTKRHGIKAQFDKLPNSIVIFRSINYYYFVYSIDWSENDQVVTRGDLEEMGLLMNRELGKEGEYLNRKSNTKRTI